MIENDHILIVPTKHSIKELKGILPKPEKAFTIEEMDDTVQNAVAEHVVDSKCSKAGLNFAAKILAANQFLIWFL